MKRLKIFLVLFLATFILLPSAQASQVYKRGIFTSKSAIKTEPSSSSSTMKSDTGGSLSMDPPDICEILGEENGYYKVKIMYAGFIYVGYVPKGNVAAYTYTTDDAYEAYLRSIGFPSDYASKLAILHAIHPNWNFTASFTGGENGGMDFYKAVDGERSVLARNVIQTSNTSLLSTEDGAYSNGQWIPLAGNGWYAVSRQTLSFFMDPRNFLDESHIFMFENLGYNAATQTADTVNKVLAGTFMTNPFECFETSNNCPPGQHFFVDTFMASGIDKKVSPVHLASRVKQEQGTTGSVLSLGIGYRDYEDLKGYYNFFNINASGSTDEEVIVNGLTYAKNKGWNNQHISIFDGSSLIGSNYVSRGQSTGYYQKFNTIVPSYYNNQYMQNVKAPYSESYSTYASYYKTYTSTVEWDKGVYDFLIPIYKNMGEYTTLDTSQNGDYTLKSMTVENCNLNPEFQSSAFHYDCYIKKEFTSTNITASATNPNAKVSGTGNRTFTKDEETAEIIVKAVNGDEGVYYVHFHRIETDGYSPEEVLNGVGIKTSNEYISNIAVGSDVSNIINSISGKYHFATVKVVDASGTEITDGLVKTGQVVTVTNAGKTNSYKVVLYGDVGGDGIIDIRDLLSVQKHLVKSKTISDAYLKAADINRDGTIDIRDLLLVQKFILGAYNINQG